METFIIAEAGVNHNGDIGVAKQLVDAALATGANAVKFQTWKTELLVTHNAEMAEYQVNNTQKHETQFQMLKRLELGYDNFIDLKAYCDEKKILFLSTPFEKDSATFLNQLQPIFKIGSGELTNIPLLRHIACFGKPIILSTGMSTLAEVKQAVDTIVNSGLALENISLLHVTTEYPTPMEEVNLRAMQTLKQAFPNVSVGYSDHTPGIEVPIAAVALGATIIEKHFTLDRDMAGPDHKASLNPAEFTAMVKSIRNIEKALGHGRKEPSPSEIKNMKIARKSLVAIAPILAGDLLTEHNMGIKRPGSGIPPGCWDEMVNTSAKKSYQPGELI